MAIISLNKRGKANPARSTLPPGPEGQQNEGSGRAQSISDGEKEGLGMSVRNGCGISRSQFSKEATGC